MYRRRRPTKNGEIAFSFDSFLDVVANVIGILLRLILITWVGARSYHAAMERIAPDRDSNASESASSVVLLKPAPRSEDDPLHGEIRKAERELEEARRSLAARLDQLDLLRSKEKSTESQFAELARLHAELTARKDQLSKEAASKENDSKKAANRTALDVETLRTHIRKLADEIKLLEKQPNPVRTRELKYFAPTSKAVVADEVIFELKHGRAAFVDIGAFLREVERGFSDKLVTLRSQWSVVDRTAPVGAFRLRYVVERPKSPAEALGERERPSNDVNYEIGLAEWTVEPIMERRGESLEAAMKPTSDFRQLVDGLDTGTVVTFCVYADSFAEFRVLRDYLHEKGFEVAARPLPDDMPIRASRNGTASRGQ